MTVRLRRSELATPGSSRKMMEKAAASDTDLVFLDLEDAVAPAQKEAARDHVVRALRELDWGKKLRAVRVNAADTRWAHDDVIALVEGAGVHLDLLILPKVKAPRDVWFFETLLEQLELKLGLGKRIGLEALIEEAAALARVEEIAAGVAASLIAGPASTTGGFSPGCSTSTSIPRALGCGSAKMSRAPLTGPTGTFPPSASTISRFVWRAVHCVTRPRTSSAAATRFKLSS